MKTAIKVILCMFIVIVTVTPIHAQSPEVTNGLNYLTTTQNPDGSWGEECSAVIFTSTLSVIETFQELEEADISNYADAVLWLQGQETDSTEYLAERIRLLSEGGDDMELLISYMDETFLWGGFKEHDINILDSILSIQALKAINYEDTETIEKALDYLLSTHTPEGGFSTLLEETTLYETALTAEVLIVL